MYQSFAALQRHLDLGKKLIRLECETQHDQVKRKWAETCQSLTEKRVVDHCQIFRYFSRLSTLHKSGRLLNDTAEASAHAYDDEDEDDVLATEATAIKTRQRAGIVVILNYCEYNVF